MNQFSGLLKIGTCSWKYPSWKGIIYSKDVGDYLNEYARHYNTVEIDQWFWSLFPGNNITLPRPEIVAGYVNAVPDDFQFSIKVPNAITLTHHYRKDKKEALKQNPFFLSSDVDESHRCYYHCCKGNGLVIRVQIVSLVGYAYRMRR